VETDAAAVRRSSRKRGAAALDVDAEEIDEDNSIPAAAAAAAAAAPDLTDLTSKNAAADKMDQEEGEDHGAKENRSAPPPSKNVVSSCPKAKKKPKLDGKGAAPKTTKGKSATPQIKKPNGFGGTGRITATQVQQSHQNMINTLGYSVDKADDAVWETGGEGEGAWRGNERCAPEAL
jgi:hypothetical protein